MTPTRIRFAMALGVFALIGPAARAQVSSGPDPGVQVESLKVLAATGAEAGQVSEPLLARKGEPTVVLFVRADVWDRPMARFLKTLDGELSKGLDNAAEAKTIAVWLTEDVAKSRDYLPRAQQSLQFDRTDLAVFEGDRFGPNGWSINGDAHLTAVVIREGKVVKSLGFVSVNETDVPAILKLLKPGN